VTLPLSKVAHIDDFEDTDFRRASEKYNLTGSGVFPWSDATFLNRKTWEIGMAILSFDKFGLLDADKEFLGIGAAKEETINILSNHSRRVFATDIYLDQQTWSDWHDGQLLIDARNQMGPNYNHRRVVWQHVDGRELPYEDNSFDGIFSCSSIEHFGNEAAIRQSIEEVCRVLKPGGVAAISSEYKISGDGEGFANVQLFDRERIQRVWLDGIPWEAKDFLDETLDNTDYIDFERSIHDTSYQQSAHPHIKLDNGQYRWTSVHFTFVKQK
jgi:SAM-dependent methyltransferase